VRPGIRSSLAATVLMLVLGFLLVAVLRSQGGLAQAASSGHPQDDLIRMVQGLEADRETLEMQVAESRRALDELGRRLAASRGLRDQFIARADTLQMEAGLVAVQGPGMRVTISDNDQPPENAANPSNYIVHDYDLRVLVNALWKGGAEAIAINGERLTLMSAIRCVGTTVLINNQQVTSPFVIDAIGDSERMTAALDSDADALALTVEQAITFQLGYSAQPASELRIPAYQGVLVPTALTTTEQT